MNNFKLKRYLTVKYCLSRRLGLETVSRRTNVSSRSRSRPFMSRAQDHFFHHRYRADLYCYGASALTVSWWACRWRRTQCERVLDVVSLCCSYYIAQCSSYYHAITMNVKDRPVIAINKTCTLTSLESYKCLVSVSSRSRAFTSRAHPCDTIHSLQWLTPWTALVERWQRNKASNRNSV